MSLCVNSLNHGHHVTTSHTRHHRDYEKEDEIHEKGVENMCSCLCRHR